MFMPESFYSLILFRSYKASFVFAIVVAILLSASGCAFNHDNDKFYDVPLVLKERNELVASVYPYVSFSDGITFNGKEVFAVRAGQGHFTPENKDGWGKILLYERSVGGIREIWPNIDYAQLPGELRDPNLSSTQFEDIFLLSCFTTDENNEHSSIIFTLNAEYEVTSQVVWQKELCGWGPVLTTPNGYLLTVAYGPEEDRPYLFRSAEPFDGNIQEVEFKKVVQLFGEGSSETAIGYYNNMLVAVSRTTDEYSLITSTDDPEGLKGWNQPRILDIQIHAPVLLEEYSGSKLPFAGCKYLDSGARAPIVGTIDFDTATTSYIVVDAKQEGAGGGYPSFVPSKEGVAVMYYDDFEYAETELCLKDVKWSSFIE